MSKAPVSAPLVAEWRQPAGPARRREPALWRRRCRTSTAWA
ncbi:hypothetical protein [Nocardioides convexus]|nr:hypothetical protein [Nocardioides convexus]